MRKSLLITSALGLVSALPTFAMATGAAAGSSSAACSSGFFAQIDAKIMNAKLEIKNEKNTKIADNQKTDDASIAADIETKFLNDLANTEFVGLFDFDIGDTIAGDKARALGFAAVPAANTIAALSLGDLKTADDDAKLTTLVNGRLTTLGGFTTAPTTPQIALIVRDLKIFRDLGVSANLADTVLVNGLLEARATKVGDIEYNPRSAGESAAAVAAKFTANAITGAVGGAKANYFGPMKNLFVLSNTNLGNPLAPNDLKTAFGDIVTGKVTPGGPGSKKFAETLNELAKDSPTFANLVANEKAARVKSNDILEGNRKAGFDVTDRRVHHHALAGGVGATAGWWQNMGGFAVSISGTGDYLWGTFRTMDDASGSSMKAEDKRKLGFGFQGDVGVHYVVSPSTTLGVLVGLRGQQLQFGRTDKTKTNSKDSKGDYASKWMWNPVVSAQARTFFTDTVYGALTVGYVIPMSERDYKLENTNIANKDAKVRFQGLTGAFSVGMMF